MKLKLILALGLAASVLAGSSKQQGIPYAKIRKDPVKKTVVTGDSEFNSHCGSLSGPGDCGTSDSVFLKTSRIEVGIHPAGSFGSAQGLPSEYGYAHYNNCPGCPLGAIVDVDGNGLENGFPPYAGDYFVPGSPVEGWSLEWTDEVGTRQVTHNYGLLNRFAIFPNSIKITSDSDTAQQALWSATTEQFQIDKTFTIAYTDSFVHVDTCITNIGADVQDLYYMRNMDPDQTQPWNNDHTTLNFVRFQPETFGFANYVNPSSPNSAAVYSVGIGYSNLNLVLGANDDRAFANHGGFDPVDPSSVYANTFSGWTDYGGADITANISSAMRTADESIQLTFKHPRLSSGEKTCFNYYFGFDVDYTYSGPTPTPEPTESPEPTETPEPTESPEPYCVDQNELLTCDLVQELNACDVAIPGSETGQKLRDLCPLNCGCCSYSGSCQCDDNELLSNIAAELGQSWVKKCSDALKYVSCYDEIYGDYIRNACPCSCPPVAEV